jgi:hypothetical protein
MARLVSKVGSREALLRARVFRAARIASEPGSVRYLGARPEGPGAECLVRSEADPRWFYHVILRPPFDPEGDLCVCPDFAKRGGPDLPCKHICAVVYWLGEVRCPFCGRKVEGLYTTCQACRDAAAAAQTETDARYWREADLEAVLFG